MTHASASQSSILRFDQSDLGSKRGRFPGRRHSTYWYKLKLHWELHAFSGAHSPEPPPSTIKSKSVCFPFPSWGARLGMLLIFERFLRLTSRKTVWENRSCPVSCKLWKAKFPASSIFFSTIKRETESSAYHELEGFFTGFCDELCNGNGKRCRLRNSTEEKGDKPVVIFCCSAELLKIDGWRTVHTKTAASSALSQTHEAVWLITWLIEWNDRTSEKLFEAVFKSHVNNVVRLHEREFMLHFPLTNT